MPGISTLNAPANQGRQVFDESVVMSGSKFNPQEERPYANGSDAYG